MKTLIEKYINEEREISKFKILMIEKSSDLSPSKKRILEIEKEFLTIPFEQLNFSEVSDVATAIKLYRESRMLFYSMYNVQRAVVKTNNEDILALIKNKVSFIKKLSDDLMTNAIYSLNVKDSEILLKDLAGKLETDYNKLKKKIQQLDYEDVANFEPAVFAKKRARIQVALYSLGKYLSLSLLNFNYKDSISEPEKIIFELNSIIDNSKNNVFKHYNDTLDILPEILNKTNGYNRYIEKIHKLQNILDFSEMVDEEPFLEKFSFFNIASPKIGGILTSYKKAIKETKDKDSVKNSQNKVFGVVFPIQRIGNEKMTLMYKNLKISGVDVSKCFDDSISNIRVGDESIEKYYKGIFIHPLWRLINDAKTDYASKILVCRLLNLTDEEFYSTNFNDENVINKINSDILQPIDLDENSKILTPVSRTDEEAMLYTKKYIEKFIDTIVKNFHKETEDY